jgi:RHS repeat-associated protein
VENPLAGNTSHFGEMDNMYYFYDAGNKLQRVNDVANKTYGFKDSSTNGTDYSYDANGNLTSDANKQITSIVYNHLNMPTEIVFENNPNKKIKFDYTADGIKIKKTVTDGSSVTTTEYCQSFVYENDNLKQFTHSEGYVELNGQGSYDYVYVYLDHLGSVRLTYSDFNHNGLIESTTEILQERNTYPFGLEHKGYNNVQNAIENNYQTYLGQEMNKELGLNWLTFRHRNYIPEIGRFFGIDPITEEYHYITPYQFASNNPAWKVELEGLEGEETSGLDLIRKGFANIWNSITGGVEATDEGMRRRSAQDRATQLSRGSNMVAEGAATKEAGHAALDVIGIADPSGIADGINALWYASEGDYTNAALSGISILPYAGDLIGKGGKALNFAVKATNFNAIFKTTGDDFLEATFKFTDGKTADFELLGQLTEDGKNLSIELGGYFKGVSNEDAVGLLGKTNIQDITSSLLEYAKQGGFENVTLSFKRTDNSTSAKKGHIFSRTFNVNE